MFFDKVNILKKLNNQSVVVGYDLGDTVSQISVAHLNDEEPITLSTVAGEEQFNIPTVLCKRRDVNQWFYGKEALRNVESEEGILVEGLIQKAIDGSRIEIEGLQIEPIELLALFIKKSFSMLGMITSLANVAAIMITVDSLTEEMVDVLTKVIDLLNVKKESVLFQSHEESAFYYIMNQEEELRKYQVGICDFAHGHLKTYCLETNRRTIPMVSFVEEKVYKDFKSKNDDEFLQVSMNLCREKIISSVFLIGENFQEDWCKRSLGYLCNGRRVFQGNNLYSKGACYAIAEKVKPTDLSREQVFLGKDKLKSNIGMRVEKEGQDAYFALLDAGENWYDARKTVDFMLDSGNVISILITPLNETESKKADIPLSGIPIRPRKTTRIHMEVTMVSESILHIYCKDMGFGDIYKSSEMEWNEDFTI